MYISQKQKMEIKVQRKCVVFWSHPSLYLSSDLRHKEKTQEKEIWIQFRELGSTEFSVLSPYLEMLFVQWQISSGVTEVQEAVLQQEPRLAKAMIPVPTLHITLLVTHLANQEQVDLWVHVYMNIHTNKRDKNTVRRHYQNDKLTINW